MEKIKVLMVMTDITSVGHFRIAWPATYLQSIDSEVEVTLRLSKDVNPWDFFNLRKYDIVHANRMFGTIESIAKIRKGLNEHGTKLVIDLDDHWEVPAGTPLRKFREDAGNHGIEKRFIENADHVTTTTKYLKKEIESVNPNVTIIPNGVNPDHPMWNTPEIPSAICRIGWLGSMNRHLDLLRMKDSIDKLYADPELKGKFSFVQVGGEDPDNKIFEGPGFQYYVGVPAGEYGKYYRNVDICLAPLVHELYNLSKSELKMAESGLMKKVFVGQDYGVYQDNIESGYNGFLIGDDDDWYSPLKKLILNGKDYRRLFGERLHKDMMVKFSQEVVAKQRIEFYKKLAYEGMV